jgi:hypothetical protein
MPCSSNFGDPPDMANHEIIHPVFGHRNLDAIALTPKPLPRVTHNERGEVLDALSILLGRVSIHMPMTSINKAKVINNVVGGNNFEMPEAA